MNVLAIDQGTSGTKAIIVDEVRVVRAVTDEPVRPECLADEGVGQDTGQVLESVPSAGRGACEPSGGTIGALALPLQDSQGSPPRPLARAFPTVVVDPVGGDVAIGLA